jgi:opacity protein-like surface antigen
MNVRTTLAAAALAALASALAAPRAQAETYITGYGGLVFGGDVSLDPGEDNKHGAYGGSIGFLGSPLGFEVDFAYSPDFFGANRALIPSNNLVTLMGNIVLSGQMGERSRVYASAGAGLMKSSVEDADEFFDVGRNDFGANAGLGVMLGVSEKLSLRADIRYFTNVGDDEPDDELDIDFGSFDYWRGTAGLSLRF